jgi:hypothetical protein
MLDGIAFSVWQAFNLQRPFRNAKFQIENLSYNNGLSNRAMF